MSCDIKSWLPVHTVIKYLMYSSCNLHIKDFLLLNSLNLLECTLESELKSQFVNSRNPAVQGCGNFTLQVHVLDDFFSLSC